MFKWIKESLFGDRLSEEYHPEHLVVKLPNISEPVISFLETVRKYPKRFDVAEDCHSYMKHGATEISEYKAYKIWDKKLEKGWYVRGKYWTGPIYFIVSLDGRKCYNEAFFITSDEKEYLIKEISIIMNYRIDRKVKLDKIRADRRIRDTRNKLKELYK